MYNPTYEIPWDDDVTLIFEGTTLINAVHEPEFTGGSIPVEHGEDTFIDVAGDEIKITTSYSEPHPYDDEGIRYIHVEVDGSVVKTMEVTDTPIGEIYSIPNNDSEDW
ncbi:hypothetical protein [Shewanella algae]|uniref:hypothetical protein n=1 Tax=Shewanella algae TaxID=38313 RepID=UPI003AAC9CBC